MNNDYKYNWDEMLRWLFTSMNDEMAVKQRVERKAKPLRKCWTFFNLHFPAPAMKAMSRICACKTEKNPQIFGWCLQFKQSCLWATLSYFCKRKQGRKVNARRRVVFRKCIKKSSALSHEKCEEVSLLIEFTTLPPKNHNLFVQIGTKRELKKQGKCGHRLIMHSITRGDEMWGGGGGSEVRRQWEGGGGRLLCANLYMSRVKWYDNTYTFQLY